MNELIGKLSAAGLATNIISQRGSCYFEFTELPQMGKVRVGDHNERGRYGYRWQIRLDKEGHWEDTTKAHKRFFFGADSLDKAVARMVRYSETIIRSMSLQQIEELFDQFGSEK
jgi:hypothetical protein